VSSPSEDFPGRDFAFLEGTAGFSLTLKRNCSISPAGLLGVFAALSAAALAIGAGFAVAGAWLILPFAGLEALLLGAAFVVYARRAADYEKIELAGGRLTVEVAEGLRKHQYDLDPRRAQVLLEKDEGYGARVWVKGRLHGARSRELSGTDEGQLEIGRHLDAGSRVGLAAELSRRLRSRIGE
jgi:uncharacterized membrane protein